MQEHRRPFRSTVARPMEGLNGTITTSCCTFYPVITPWAYRVRRPQSGIAVSGYDYRVRPFGTGPAFEA